LSDAGSRGVRQGGEGRKVSFWAQPPAEVGDKFSVSGLTENTRRIMDTAMDANRMGLDPSDWTIFIGPEGGLELIAGLDNPLESLTWSRGARMAWQVRHEGGGVRVEGLTAGERCRLRQDSPRVTAGMLLGANRMYQFATAV